MAKSCDICNNTIIDQINSKVNFTYSEIANKIIENGGVLRLAPTYTLYEYVKELEEAKIIFFNSYMEPKGSYQVFEDGFKKAKKEKSHLLRKIEMGENS